LGGKPHFELILGIFGENSDFLHIFDFCGPWRPGAPNPSNSQGILMVLGWSDRIFANLSGNDPNLAHLTHFAGICWNSCHPGDFWDFEPRRVQKSRKCYVLCFKT